MEQPDFNAQDLIKRYLDGTCTDAERQLVGDWFNSLPDARQTIDEVMMEQDLRLLDQRMQKLSHKTTIRLWPKIAGAALVLLMALLAISYFIYTRSLKNGGSAQIAHFDEVVQPGSSQALLTRTDGKTIALSGEKGGLVLRKDGLAYADGTRINIPVETAPSGNYQLQTPRGGQYQLTLPDSTKVWLNAESKLTYPASFEVRDRQVELVGEAYFEVHGDPDKPFRVISQGQEVQVLGTSFNVAAYQDEEAIRTTLLNGAVQVASGNKGSTVRLEPGEEAVLRKNGELAKRKADVELALAWKEGLFSFRQADLSTVMRTLSRWYNMEVSYEGRIPDWQFSGKLLRTDRASKVLDLLDYYGIHYRVDGNRIVINGE